MELVRLFPRIRAFCNKSCTAMRTPCGHGPATPGRSTSMGEAAESAGRAVGATRHRVRVLAKRQQKVAVLMPATAAPSNTPTMPHTQLFCCQSAARVPLPPLPQAQPETRAPPCRQSPSRSSHRFGATLPRTASCDFDLGHERGLSEAYRRQH